VNRPQVAVLLRLLVVFLVYFAAGKFGLTLAFMNASATAVWPPTGIALAAFLLMGPGMWPAILAGAFLVNLTTSGSVVASLVIAAGNSLEGAIGAYLVQRFANGPRAFNRAQDIFRYTALAGLLAPSVSATIGVTSLVLGGLAVWSDFGSVWLTWWLGDATGAILVAPLLILWATHSRLHWDRRRALEAGLLVAALVVVTLFVFGGLSPLNVKDYPLEFLILPIVLWAAFRFGQRATVTLAVLLSGIAIWGTLHGLGPFARETPNEALLLLQAFVAATCITGLVLAALAADNARLFGETQALNAQLESRIAQRTAQLQQAQSEAQALSQRLLAAREEERASIAREVHDELGQQLTGFKYEVARLDKAIGNGQSPALREITSEMSHNIDATIETVRRIATELRPAILDDFGLLAAIQWQVEDAGRRMGIVAHYESQVETLELDREASAAIFRVCQEALTNIARHSGATRVDVSIGCASGEFVLVVHDNGRGISKTASESSKSLGLMGMRERAHLARGTLEIDGASDSGTTVTIRVPLTAGDHTP
jgi:signal transduction histidine kinase